MLHRRYTMTVATSALFFVCIMLHAQTRIFAQDSTPYTDSEAYRVYESLLPADWTVTTAHAHRLLIEVETGTMDFCLTPAPESATLLQPLFDRFIALNKIEWRLQPKLHLEQPYEFVPREDIQAFFKPGATAWEGLLVHYPESASSYIILSPVAFNADKTLAIVYMGHSCGTQCGGGSFHVLEKKDGIWKNLKWKGTSCAWAS